METNSNKNYEVGYKRPPKEHQFKSGQPSSNPKGRPKLVQDFDSDLREELEEVITIQEGGKAKKVTKQRAILKRIVANAVNGNTSSIKIIVSAAAKLPLITEDLEKELSPEDAQILEDYIKRRTNHDNKPSF